MSPAPSFFETVNSYFDKAAALTDYPPGLLEQIKVCDSVYSFQFPIRRAGWLRGDLRLARAAQSSPRARQGRHPLRPPWTRTRSRPSPR